MNDADYPATARTALSLRLCEASLEAEGWRAVVRVLRAGLLGRCEVDFWSEDGVASAPAPTDAPLAQAPPHAARSTFSARVPGFGVWTVRTDTRDGEAPAVPAVLKDALALAARLEADQPPRPAELEAVLDTLPYAAVLLDGGARLVFANSAGEDFLSTRWLFRGGRTAVRLRAAPRWEETFETALARLDPGDAGPQTWVPDQPAFRPRIAIRLARLGSGPGIDGPPGAARILMTVREGDLEEPGSSFFSEHRPPA